MFDCCCHVYHSWPAFTRRHEETTCIQVTCLRCIQGQSCSTGHKLASLLLNLVAQEVFSLNKYLHLHQLTKCSAHLLTVFRSTPASVSPAGTDTLTPFDVTSYKNCLLSWWSDRRGPWTHHSRSEPAGLRLLRLLYESAIRSSGHQVIGLNRTHQNHLPHKPKPESISLLHKHPMSLIYRNIVFDSWEFNQNVTKHSSSSSSSQCSKVLDRNQNLVGSVLGRGQSYCHLYFICCYYLLYCCWSWVECHSLSCELRYGTGPRSAAVYMSFIRTDRLCGGTGWSTADPQFGLYASYNSSQNFSVTFNIKLFFCHVESVWDWRSRAENWSQSVWSQKQFKQWIVFEILKYLR